MALNTGATEQEQSKTHRHVQRAKRESPIPHLVELVLAQGLWSAVETIVGLAVRHGSAKDGAGLWQLQELGVLHLRRSVRW